MKIQTGKVFTIFLILILIGIMFYNSIGTSKIDKSKIELADAKISLLESENVILVQSHVKDSIAIDSLTGLIQQAKYEVSLEQERREYLENENKVNLSKFEALSENDQVEEFIVETGGSYPVMKYDGYYLVSLESIQFAKRSFITSDYRLEKLKSFELEVKSFNELILDYDKRFEIFTSSYISDMNTMLANKDKIINNLNAKISIYDKSFARLRLSKQLTIGFGIVAIGYLLINH